MTKLILVTRGCSDPFLSQAVEGETGGEVVDRVDGDRAWERALSESEDLEDPVVRLFHQEQEPKEIHPTHGSILWVLRGDASYTSFSNT